MSDTKNKVKEIFREYLKENFKQTAENLKIYIYGHELQICGGILNFEDELDISIKSNLNEFFHKTGFRELFRKIHFFNRTVFYIDLFPGNRC